MWMRKLNAKFIVRAGSRWCIGSEANIPICEEPWLSNGMNISVPDTSVIQPHNTNVAALLDQNTKNRNHGLINNLFDHITAEAINV
jgi:hypothetical protein